jgi:DMSO/TMAO reductase YedYZ molybdopterin-dependent catalytic subunit
LAGVTRRDFFTAAICASATAFARQNPSAQLVGTLPLGNPAAVPPTPLNRLLGTGLSARLFTDLSTLDSNSAASVTPTDRFFIRTACPSALPDAASWSIDVAGLVDSPSPITLATLQTLPFTRMRCLLECSGNTDPANYGLLSTAEWEGVPITTVLDRLKPSSRTWRVLVSGVDDPIDTAGTSVPGASWIFAVEDLHRALLALRMNGAPLPRDHGSPVRLIVPGWYGCACIKWVNRIELAANDAEATAQMREFASRTHQPSDPRGAPPVLARDYIPAVIDTAAMPVRVEKWSDASRRTFYRVVGIIWGGTEPTNALSIRFRSTSPWTRVENCPLPTTPDTWSLWTHTWRPTEPGRYDIVLRVDDPSIRTKRLDIFFYARSVTIDDR